MPCRVWSLGCGPSAWPGLRPKEFDGSEGVCRWRRGSIRGCSERIRWHPEKLPAVPRSNASQGPCLRVPDQSSPGDPGTAHERRPRKLPGRPRISDKSLATHLGQTRTTKSLTRTHRRVTANQNSRFAPAGETVRTALRSITTNALAAQTPARAYSVPWRLGRARTGRTRSQSTSHNPSRRLRRSPLSTVPAGDLV